MEGSKFLNMHFPTKYFSKSIWYKNSQKKKLFSTQNIWDVVPAVCPWVSHIKKQPPCLSLLTSIEITNRRCDLIHAWKASWAGLVKDTDTASCIIIALGWLHFWNPSDISHLALIVGGNISVVKRMICITAWCILHGLWLNIFWKGSNLWDPLSFSLH